MLRGELRFLLSSFIMLVLLGAGARTAGAEDTEAFAAEVLRLVNRERAAQTPSLPPLQPAVELQRAAAAFAHYMGEERFFNHTGPDGSTPESRIEREGYRWTAWAENIAAGQSTPARVMNAWMNSPGHRANILNPRFREIGIGVAVVSGSPYRIYWVQNFGDRSDIAAAVLPEIVAVEPARAIRGVALTLRGENLGTSGTVVFEGGVAGVVGSWSATRVAITVPEEAQSGGVYIQTAAGQSNVVALQVDNPPPPPILPGFAPRNRIAVFRPDTQQWFLRGDDGSTTTVQFGGPGDRPVPADYLGTGRAQIAVFRPTTREWFIRTDAGGTVRVEFGGPGDIPVPADYFGLKRAQIAVFRPATGQWFIRNDDGSATPVAFGGPGDQPIPGDYFGLKRASLAVFRPDTGQWFLRTDAGGTVPIQWGAAGDLPVPGDYFGVGRRQIAVFRPANATFYLRTDAGQTTAIPFGARGDIPVPGDYFGMGRTLPAVYRPGTGQWFIRADSGVYPFSFGGPGDQPIPAMFAFRFGMP